MSEPGDAPTRKRPGARRPPRKLSARYLENAAVHHLGRHATTVTQLRRVLLRKVDRALRAHGGDRGEALGWVDAVLQKLVRARLLDDVSYAETKARSLRAAGRSVHVIRLKLRAKGVAADVVSRTMTDASSDVSEEAAARIWARKKRLGPFRRDPASRQANRQRDLASLARAGFSFPLARLIIDAT